jgi:hypothetical protein
MLLTLGTASPAVATGPFSAPDAHPASDRHMVCGPEFRLPATAYLDRISTGWRPLGDGRLGVFGTVDEVTNARIIHRAFVEAGYPDSIAFAAIVNAWSESALDNNARMNRRFVYKDKVYPDGTGAIGLFQLLPSVSGAGGPSGIEQGYSRDFMDGRYAGTRWQATRYFDKPDALGRRYYDGTDARLNTERIILEVERDGERLIKAAERGASIAELADIFGRDIERPSISTRYRRKLAADMLGRDLAYARHPERLFAPEPEPFERHLMLAQMQCPWLPPAPAPTVEEAPPWEGQSTFLGGLAMAVSGIGAWVPLS